MLPPRAAGALIQVIVGKQFSPGTGGWHGN